MVPKWQDWPEVVLDARWVERELSGIGRYTVAILREFAAMRPEFRFCVLAGSEERAAWLAAETGAAGDGRFSFVPVAGGPFSPRGQWAAARLARKRGAAVFHSTNFMLPLPLAGRKRPHATKCVCNIHDLIPLAHPEFTPKALKTRFFPVYRALMREIAARGDAFVTASDSAKGDMMRLLGVEEGRILVATDGVDGRYRPGGEKPSARGEAKRILYVGRADPYKNLAGLVRAFARARELGLPAGTRLLVAGSPDSRYPEAAAEARRLGLGDAVEWLGYVDDAALLKAYQEADLLALLSRYEGFGLPVAEAMACGTPVLCSDAASLPEVAGAAARLVAPDDTEGAARAMVKVLSDPAEAARLRLAGLARAGRFSWRASASALLGLYERLVRA